MGKQKSRSSRLLAYATLIANTFSETLDTLSATGISLPYSLRQTQKLSRTTQQRDSLEQSDPIIEFGEDLEYLDCWCNAADRKPLLVTAPFGFGKSSLLAATAVRLA